MSRRQSTNPIFLLFLSADPTHILGAVLPPRAPQADVLAAEEEEPRTKNLFINAGYKGITEYSLCGKCLDMSEVLKPVISTVNFIRSFGLNHRQSDNLLKRLEKMTYLIILPYSGLVAGKSFSVF
nr:unnamed protein product [Callosobruchus analis]